MRLEMLEHCAERRLRMERGYLAADAPKEERRARGCDAPSRASAPSRPEG